MTKSKFFRTDALKLDRRDKTVKNNFYVDEVDGYFEVVGATSGFVYRLSNTKEEAQNFVNSLNGTL